MKAKLIKILSALRRQDHRQKLRRLHEAQKAAEAQSSATKTEEPSSS
jgi:hypothetical protein